MNFLKKLCLIPLCLLLISCGVRIEHNMGEPMSEFEFTTESGSHLRLTDLEGEWWLANLVYTSCRTICPRTTANMAYVQQELKKEQITPQIVSFTVDPKNDHPDKLKQYAEKYDADLETWSFLTGYDFATIQQISEASFKSGLREGAEGQRSHGYGFYLINPQGEVVKKYDGMSNEELTQLMDDVKKVF